MSRIAWTTAFLVTATALLGCGSDDRRGEPASTTPATTQVPAPPLPIVVEAPDDGAVIRARLAAGRAIAQVRLRGGAEPGAVIEADGGCAARSCTQTLSADALGAWEAELRLVLPASRTKASVTLTYVKPRAPGEPTRIRVRLDVPRPEPVNQRTRVEQRGPGLQAFPSQPQTSDRTGRLVVIGDSLAVGMRGSLGGQLPGWSVSIDAAIGRHLHEGIEILRRTQVGGAVLAISLFTNDDPWRTQQLEAAVRESVARARCAVWATIVAPPVNELGYERANALLEHLARELPALRLVRWADTIASRPQLMSRDGVHPTPAGFTERARLYASAAHSC